MKRIGRLCSTGLLLASLAAGMAYAQERGFGNPQDVKQPVEVTADNLSVDQATGKAVFSGNVLVGQGTMRLAADTVAVQYDSADARRITGLVATGHVTLAAGNDAAEAAQADYDVASGNVVLTGNVLLTQGQNVMAGERVVVNLATGTANVSGRVRSVLQPGGQ